MSVDYVILAAGNSSRMKSSLPKFFHTIAGKSIIGYIIDTISKCNPHNVVVVTQNGLRNSEHFCDVTVRVQAEPLGTADAVRYAIDALVSEYTIILCGDMPLISPNHLKNLENTSSDSALIAMILPHEFRYMPYGRVVLNNGKFDKIVEYKNASDDEKSISLANTGVYKIRTELLKKYIPKIEKNAFSGEYYLTDIFESITDVAVVQSPDYDAFHGINTMQDLARAEAIMQNRLRQKFMANGVKLIAPETIYFSHDTVIESEVTIEPNVIIGTNVKIGSGSRVYAFSHIQDCIIAQNVEIGPFARIRGHSSFADGSAIGNFVEVKGSTFGAKTKAKHLAYIGDTTIGENTNIGAGTITCNYDGVKKHKTTIGNNVFVGSNSTLVAPIAIEDNTILGAGSTFTDTVPAGALAIARQRQINLPQKAHDIWNKKMTIP